jgi:putative ABC transport system permease protein
VTASQLRTSLALAVRELRGGLRGFAVFIACIALGVFAIAGVGAIASSLGEGLSKQGRTLLGGDIAFSLQQREASAEELAFLRQRGDLATLATLRGMVKNSAGDLGLVEVKAVDLGYPRIGALVLKPQLSTSDLLARQGDAFGAAADPALLARLGLTIGDRVTLGAASFVIRSTVESEPDKLAGGIGFGPRFLISQDALRATGLLQPGSLVRWTYRLVLPNPTDAAAQSVIAAARTALPQAGWEVRSRSNASPQLERNITRFTQYLSLVGLAALLIGGVGVASAVKAHVDRRRDTIAVLKAVGAGGTQVFAIYLIQVMLLALLGSLIGLALGAALPFALVAVLGSLLPLPVEPLLQPGSLALSLLYGLLTALAFALWPLGRVQDIPVAALFRDNVDPATRRPRRRYILMLAMAAVLLVGSVIVLSYDKRVAGMFVACAAAAFLAFRLVALLTMALARRLPRPRAALPRLALANVHRPDALTPSVMLSLGLGLTVLVTVMQIDGNLRRQFSAGLPERAPSFYFIDIPSSDAARFDQFLRARAPSGQLEEVPMLRGRIVAARGVSAEELKPSHDAAWVLQSDRGLSYTDQLPRGSKVVEGEWWPPGYSGPPLVSFEKRLADGLGLKLGDEVSVNVLGRNINARIASLRSVDWQSLGINFVMVFSPNTFRGAPHTHIATLTDPHSSAAQDATLIKEVAAAFPGVTAIRVREALEAVGSVIANLTMAIRGASAITLISALLVLGGALAAGHRHRVYDAVVLRTLGATRAGLLGAYALEYLVVGLATAAVALLAGSLAAWLIVTRLMTLSFSFDPVSALAVLALALGCTIGFGLVGTVLALGRKPAAVLRTV